MVRRFVAISARAIRMARRSVGDGRGRGALLVAFNDAVAAQAIDVQRELEESVTMGEPVTLTWLVATAPRLHG